MEAFRIIQVVVTPVVLISANGLICLALYNRLAAVVTRLRIFHKERFDVSRQLSAMPLEEQAEHHAHQLRVRSAVLEEQVRGIMRRAALLRNALICMMAAVVLLLGCSLTLGMADLGPAMQDVALGLFIAGVLVMMAGPVLAIIELMGALDPVTAEGEERV
ncbi:MAG: DUF2721 domain-containing protein [Planctomycetes bacterium]|nr:DUF2721 domain-containing protein [Planctomycetota bacterium]